jgi:uncharacterized protein (DUF2236 family)
MVVLGVPKPAPGALFDERSVSWQVVSRWTVLAGGPAAVLLQVAHPSVAAGVAEHSSYATDPLGRLERTLHSMLAISFGSPERREATLAELRNVHRAVQGTRPDGETYRALDPDLQRWVWATLVHVALEVERRYLRVPEASIPADLAAFEKYVVDTIGALEVTHQARAIARSVLRPGVWWAPRPLMVPLEWVTVDLLGPELSAAYGLPPLSPAQRRALRSARRVSRRVLPALPEPLLANPLNRRAIA